MAPGFADLHNHQFSYLGFGGRVVHGRAFGDLDRALPHCDFVTSPSGARSMVHGPRGLLDLAGNVYQGVYHRSILGHKVGGYPEFDGWPRWDSFTHQSVHEEWLHRAVQGGLRLMVMLAVNNEFVCRYSRPMFSCDDMRAVDLQLAAARELEASIDGRYEGSKQGWYRIVSTPDEARAVIEAGKLAVVLGIEVDYLFRCRTEGDLTEDQLRRELDRYYELGVRHLFPVHFSDNGFGGAAFANALQRATKAELPDGSIENLLISPLNPLGPLGAYVIQTEDASAFGYKYRTGRRNVQGLTNLGKTLIHESMDRGMIIDVDHMSARSRADVFDICEQRDYPVVAGHTAFVQISRGDRRMEKHLLPEEVERIRSLGGTVAVLLDQGGRKDTTPWHGPGQPVVAHTCGSTSNTVIQAYLHAVSMMGGGPVGVGTDFNGFAGLPGPRHGRKACPGGRGPGPNPTLDYPFRAAATGELMARSVVGRKTFDLNVDGLAHAGMLPDLIADFEAMGLSRTDLEPLLGSADGYVTMWEKASCR
jgi:microsomal dipeptidase-like Zn-dependent dipeptidase